MKLPKGLIFCIHPGLDFDELNRILLRVENKDKIGIIS